MEQMTLDLIRQVGGLQTTVDGLVKPEVARDWRTWTPTVTQSVAVGVTVGFARYITIGNIVILTAYLTCTGAGTGGNAIVIGGLPFNLANSGVVFPIGSVIVWDITAGFHVGNVLGYSASALRFFVGGATVANYIGISPNFALAAGDVITFTATYEK